MLTDPFFIALQLGSILDISQNNSSNGSKEKIYNLFHNSLKFRFSKEIFSLKDLILFGDLCF
jgi:hypothetical protein